MSYWWRRCKGQYTKHQVVRVCHESGRNRFCKVQEEGDFICTHGCLFHTKFVSKKVHVPEGAPRYCDPKSGLSLESADGVIVRMFNEKDYQKFSGDMDHDALGFWCRFPNVKNEVPLWTSRVDWYE